MTLAKQLGILLRELRESRGPELTQAKLGGIFYMTQKKISRMELGEAPPCAEDLTRYCNYFHVSADYLLGLPAGLPYPERHSAAKSSKRSKKMDDEVELTARIGMTMRNFREDQIAKISQYKLGKALHMTQKKISRMESGVAAPCAEDIYLYCSYFHISADYLLGLPQGLPYPEPRASRPKG